MTLRSDSEAGSLADIGVEGEIGLRVFRAGERAAGGLGIGFVLLLVAIVCSNLYALILFQKSDPGDTSLAHQRGRIPEYALHLRESKSLLEAASRRDLSSGMGRLFYSSQRGYYSLQRALGGRTLVVPPEADLDRDRWRSMALVTLRVDEEPARVPRRALSRLRGRQREEIVIAKLRIRIAFDDDAPEAGPLHWIPEPRDGSIVYIVNEDRYRDLAGQAK
jgi:hypothetical protein